MTDRDITNNNVPLNTESSENEAQSQYQHLAGLNLAQAKDFVVQHIATAKQLQKELDEIKQSIQLWQQRVHLARKKGMDELSAQAEQRLDEFTEKQKSIQLELWDIQHIIPQLQQELTRMTSFTPSVDANQLLEQLEQIVGKDRIMEEKISEKIESEELDDELAALKEKIKKKGPSQE